MPEVEPVREQHLILIRCSRQYAQAAGPGVASLGLAGGCWLSAGLLRLPKAPAWSSSTSASPTWMAWRWRVAYVRALRQKLEAAGAPRLLQTVRGVGYVLRDEP
jgi:hypothetical protein